MSLTRREFLRLAGLVASGVTLASCSPIYRELARLESGVRSYPDIPLRDFQILARLTYGPGPFEREKAATSGIKSWIEEQLWPEHIEDSGLDLRLRDFDFLEEDANLLAEMETPSLVLKLKQAALLRKIYSRRQLYEMMVEFWTNHFNITVAKGDCWFLKPVDDRQVIRMHALGNFSDLLWASAHSPAMLVYLDNQANHREAPNENYARELLELHTLGVSGGYSQHDVMDLARCLTGWSVKDHFWRGEYQFIPENHDKGAKTVLNLNIQPSGIAEAERVLDEIAVHPATARHLAIKLAERFLVDDPEHSIPATVNKAAEVFKATGGDIRAVLESLLLDGLEALDLSRHRKYRRPLDFMAAALRSVEAETNGGAQLQEYLKRMGQPLFEWPTPDGPPLDSRSWEGNLLPRWQFAIGMTLNDIPDTRIPESLISEMSLDGSPYAMLQKMSRHLLGAPIPESLHAELAEQIEAGSSQDDSQTVGLITAGLLASPAFQWR